jgi:hypothetical protein
MIDHSIDHLDLLSEVRHDHHGHGCNEAREGASAAAAGKIASS